MTCTRRRFLIGLGAGSIALGSSMRHALAEGTIKGKGPYAMIHDEERCNGCNICVEACRKTNGVPAGAARLSIAHVVLASSAESTDYQYFRASCQQCDEAPCIGVCPTGASYRDQGTGIVRVAKAKCIGCGYCLSACPYQVRYLNRRTKVADKCDFCLESRLSKGFDPICTTACPQQALTFGREDSPKVQAWLAGNQHYEYRLSGTGKPHLYRRYAQHRISKTSGKEA